MSNAHLSVAVALAVTLAAAPLVAQPAEPPATAPAPLDTALALYAAASYEEALAALDLVGGSPARSAADLLTIERHRLLCLVALGRTAAAEDVVARLVDASPDFVLTAGDASPRVRAVFDAARARALPALVRRRYADAKRAYDAGEFEAAHNEFTRVMALLSMPALTALDPSATDLQMLAAGFQQLSATALEQARAAREQPAVLQATPAEPRIALARYSGLHAGGPELEVAATIPPVATAPVATAPSPPAGAPAPVAAPATGVVAPRFAPIPIFTYDWRHKDVVPPVALAQPVTGWWGSMGEPPPGTQLGAIDLVVDETGAVTDARIYLSVNRVYDNVLLQSAKQWRYQPATKDGRAVKYRRVTGVVSGR